jgi:hypothetical protein
MFEAFWQGRLIPGARIDSLPFVEVRLICCVRHPPLHAAPNTACWHYMFFKQEASAWPKVSRKALKPAHTHLRALALPHAFPVSTEGALMSRIPAALPTLQFTNCTLPLF